MVDGVGVVLAPLVPPALNDYDNVHESLLPYLAWQRNALAYDVNGTDRAKREAIKRAGELNALVGYDAAFDLLLEISGSSGYLVYAEGASPDYVLTMSVYITPPLDRLGDAVFVSHLTHAVRKIKGFWVLLGSVHILTEERSNVKTYHSIEAIARTGWPNGITV